MEQSEKSIAAINTLKSNSAVMSSILASIVEVKETKDANECAKYLRSGNWIAINAAFTHDGIKWALGRPGRTV